MWLRGQYNNNFRRGKLTDRQLALLREAGAELRPYDPWADGCGALADLKAANGTLRIPAGLRTPGGLKLSNWAGRQRALWNAGLLTTAQARQLEELGFAPNPEADQWRARYAQARAWNQEHGHLAFPAQHPLRSWLYKQRKKHSQGQLPDDRGSLLRALGALNAPDADSGAPS